jgi:hypothetical protein
MWPRKVDALLSFDPNKKGWSSDSVLGERLLRKRGSLVLHEQGHWEKLPDDASGDLLGI